MAPKLLVGSAAVLVAAVGAFYLFPTRKNATTMAYPTDPYVSMQYNMVNTHDTFKAAYKVIMPHLDNPPLHDLDNFLGYTRAWASCIVEHHDSEEESLFPFLSTKLDFSHEIEQHVPIERGLTEILAYIDASRADLSTFDAKKLKSLMEALAGPLFEHLDEEVENLAPERMKAFTEEELKQAGKELMVWIRAHSQKYVTLPFMRSHTPPELKEIWPPFPWFVKRVVVPWFLAPKHAGYWKYAPYDMQ